MPGMQMQLLQSQIKKSQMFEFRNIIQMLAQIMTSQNSWVHAHVNENGGSVATTVPNFVRMNPPEFLGSQTDEDP